MTEFYKFSLFLFGCLHEIQPLKALFPLLPALFVAFLVLCWNYYTQSAFSAKEILRLFIRINCFFCFPVLVLACNSKVYLRMSA